MMREIVILLVYLAISSSLKHCATQGCSRVASYGTLASRRCAILLLSLLVSLDVFSFIDVTFRAQPVQSHSLLAAQGCAPRLPNWATVRIWKPHSDTVQKKGYLRTRWRVRSLLLHASTDGHGKSAEPQMPRKRLHQAAYFWRR